MIIVFIPGLLCTSAVWGSLNSLRQKYKCIDADVCSSSSIEKMANNIIQEINIDENYCIIGISMGGYVALELAVNNFFWLKKIILISTTYKSVDPTTILDRLTAMKLAEQDDMDSILSLSSGKSFFNNNEELLDLEGRMAYEIGSKNYLNQQNAILNRKSYEGKLTSIKHHTLIVSSKDDKVISHKDSVAMYEKIDHSELILFSKCGHLPTLEKSKETENIIKSFLET